LVAKNFVGKIQWSIGKEECSKDQKQAFTSTSVYNIKSFNFHPDKDKGTLNVNVRIYNNFVRYALSSY